MQIESWDNSKKVRLNIINHSEDSKYLRVPLGLYPYQINLSSPEGTAIEMTPQGLEELTEPAIGSVRIVTLKTGKTWTKDIDLGHLFHLPDTGSFICNIRRVVFFSDPFLENPEKDWVAFPEVTLKLGGRVLQKDLQEPQSSHSPHPGEAGGPAASTQILDAHHSDLPVADVSLSVSNKWIGLALAAFVLVGLLSAAVTKYNRR